jgi:hypothetical protein
VEGADDDGSSEPWSSRAGDINQERALAISIATRNQGDATWISGAEWRMNGRGIGGLVAARDPAGFRVAERIGMVRGSGALIFLICSGGEGGDGTGSEGV